MINPKVESDIKVFGLGKLHPNTSIKFDANGLEVQVSLNIEPEMRPHLASVNVFKGNKMWVYSIRKHIKSEFVCAKTILLTQDTLLNRCMIRVREAKQKVLAKEIVTLKSN